VLEAVVQVCSGLELLDWHEVQELGEDERLQQALVWEQVRLRTNQLQQLHHQMQRHQQQQQKQEQEQEALTEQTPEQQKKVLHPSSCSASPAQLQE